MNIIIAAYILPIAFIGHVLSNNHRYVFEKKEALTWSPRIQVLPKRMSAWMCARTCDTGIQGACRCLGYKLESCSAGLCECGIMVMKREDQMNLSYKKYDNLWVRLCPEGYIPMGKFRKNGSKQYFLNKRMCCSFYLYLPMNQCYQTGYLIIISTSVG